MTFRTPDEAVEKANNTMYGLSAGIWTDKGAKIFKIASAAEGGRHLGQHLQQVRSELPVRRLQRAALAAKADAPRRVLRGRVMAKETKTKTESAMPEAARATRRS